jgi:predicted nucleotidyltransferase
MRLSPSMLAAIREETHRLDPSAEVWLFGSRIDDDAKGGDIDLLVVSEHLNFEAQLRLRMAILDRIGWQQLDLIVRHPNQLGEPLAAMARAQGIRL